MGGRTSESEVAGEIGAGPIDLEHLNRATFGNRALAHEVLTLFDRQADKLLTVIGTTTDARARREAAHAMRGAALGIGATEVAQAAEELEADDLDPAAVAGATGRLAARVSAVRLEIGKILAGD